MNALYPWQAAVRPKFLTEFPSDVLQNVVQCVCQDPKQRRCLAGTFFSNLSAAEDILRSWGKCGRQGLLT